MAIEWISPVIGGFLVSLSFVLFVILNGTAFSLGDMLKNTLEIKPSVSWNNQILFIIGIIVSPIIFTALFYPIRVTTLNNEPMIIIFSGLLVGAGSELCKGGIITKATIGCVNNLNISITLIMLYVGFAILTQSIINF